MRVRAGRSVLQRLYSKMADRKNGDVTRTPSIETAAIFTAVLLYLAPDQEATGNLIIIALIIVCSRCFVAHFGISCVFILRKLRVCLHCCRCGLRRLRPVAMLLWLRWMLV